MATYSTSEKTRKALIESAGQLVAELGLGAVSTRAIVKHANENLGTIHYHFGSKEDLLKEMLRYACNKVTGPELSEIFEKYKNDLNDKLVQADLIRKIVQHMLQKILAPDRARWSSRVVYQVHQHAGPLRDFLNEIAIDPFFETITSVVRIIQPEWESQDIDLWIHLTIGPIVFHADHIEIILERLGAEVFPESYLSELEQRILSNALRSLGLPDDDRMST